MTYQVVWKTKAEQDLAAIWLKQTDRKAVAAAAYILDLRLGNVPWDEGESRPGNRRITFEFPLAIFYRIHESQKIVEVLHAWSFE